jgi:hypothetical protein
MVARLLRVSRLWLPCRNPGLSKHATVRSVLSAPRKVPWSRPARAAPGRSCSAMVDEKAQLCVFDEVGVQLANMGYRGICSDADKARFTARMFGR